MKYIPYRDSPVNYMKYIPLQGQPCKLYEQPCKLYEIHTLQGQPCKLYEIHTLTGTTL